MNSLDMNSWIWIDGCLGMNEWVSGYESDGCLDMKVNGCLSMNRWVSEYGVDMKMIGNRVGVWVWGVLIFWFSDFFNFKWINFRYKKTTLVRGFFWDEKLGGVLLSHGEAPHYHRRYCVSLLSSEWIQVVPQCYCRQAKFGLHRSLIWKSCLDFLIWLSFLFLKIKAVKPIWVVWLSRTGH